MTLHKGTLVGLRLLMTALYCFVLAHGARAQTVTTEETAGWVQLPGAAVDVSINSEGQAYAIGENGTPWRWDAVEQRWRRMSGTFVRVTAAQGNRPWAVNAEGVVYRYNGLWWEDKDTTVSDVAADALGNVYIAKFDGTIHKWNPLRSEWRAVPGRAKRLALDETGHPWAVTNTGRIRSYDGEAWTDYPGQAQDIAVAGDSTVVIADGDGRVRIWNAERRQWGLVEGVSNVVAVAATPNGRPWAIVMGGRLMAMARLISPEKIKQEKGRAEEIHAPGAVAPVETAEVPVPPRAQVDTPAPSSPSASSPQAPRANANVEITSTPQAQSATMQESAGNQTGVEVPTMGVNLAGGDPATSTYSGKISFVDTQKTAASLAIGGDGSVFGLDAGGNVLRWSNDNQRFESFPGTLVRIAVDKNGNPWGISTLGRVFRHDGARWSQIQNATASDIAIGFDGSVVIANASGQLYKLNEAETVFGLIKGRGVSIAVGPDGTPWTIRSDNLVQRCDVSPCKVIGQKAISISVGPDGSVWVVSTDNQLKRLNNDGMSFETIQTPGHIPSKVAVGPNGYPWVVSADKVALASAFFERDETADRTVAASTSGDTTGSGAISPLASSRTSSFTFSKNMRFETVTVDSANELSPGAKAMLESDLDGRVWAYNDGSKFLYYDSDRRKFVAAKNTTIDTLGLADFAVAPDNVYWGYKSETGKLYRDKNGTSKRYVPTTETGATNFNGVDVGPDGTVYVSVYFVGAKYYLYTKAPNSEVFKKFSTQQVRDIAVGPGSDIWIIGDNARVMHWTGTKFEEPSSTTFQASEISISKVDGTVYVNKFSSYDLYKWNATNETFDAVSNTAAQYFAVDADGRPWICNDNTPVIKRAR